MSIQAVISLTKCFKSLLSGAFHEHSLYEQVVGEARDAAVHDDAGKDEGALHQKMFTDLSTVQVVHRWMGIAFKVAK